MNIGLFGGCIAYLVACVGIIVIQLVTAEAKGKKGRKKKGEKNGTV